MSRTSIKDLKAEIVYLKEGNKSWEVLYRQRGETIQGYQKQLQDVRQVNFDLTKTVENLHRHYQDEITALQDALVNLKNEAKAQIVNLAAKITSESVNAMTDLANRKNAETDIVVAQRNAMDHAFKYLADRLTPQD